MVSRLEAVTFDVPDASVSATFWAGVLGRDVVPESAGALVPGDETRVGLRFVTSDAPRVGPDRLHLHLTSTTPEDQQRTVDTILSLGGRHADVGQDPEDEFVVFADPGGHAHCVIEPRNGFLSGTGLLGEVTCDGTRDVGLFWRDALGWSLVWDENGETAVQSPRGGTKVSWGGEPVEPRHGRNRQRFDLRAADPDREADRLVALGATRLEEMADGIELADVDGNEFTLRAD
ncbi:VOC family protein [Luteipulveratus sp. YIM 133132]|uniref:VOC family protein n=1 Tax=Luteipulveratus flavus TaxID=3031728 RepID=UPI0023B18F3E|nr:VOC family protein [Luteipulveratus sp. YIM 133132]MDE9366690.1 VOC family protein [Luteipulveratus sp. YIM 133132]